MGVKIRGAAEVKKKLDVLIGNIQTKKAVRAVYTALFIVGAESATMTPRDTSALINSQFRDINIVEGKVFGKVGYSAEYAAYVHNMSGKLKGKPRASVKSFTTKSGKVAFASDQGNFWDPTGEPQFLSKAVTNTDKQVREAIKKEMEL